MRVKFGAIQCYIYNDGLGYINRHVIEYQDRGITFSTSRPPHPTIPPALDTQAFAPPPPSPPVDVRQQTRQMAALLTVTKALQVARQTNVKLASELQHILT